MAKKEQMNEWLTQTWNAFSDILFRFIQSRVDTKEDAEDILQEVFIKTHLSMNKFDTATNINAWLFTITRNTIIDYYRTKKKGYEFDERMANTLFEEGINSNQPEFCCLEPHINELPEKYRDTIFKSEILGMKHQDIANELGVSLSAIKSQVVRGRELLKEKFVSCCKYHLNEEGKLSGDPDCERPECNH
jgi:RNA polymerase sigma-70 factor, ECF subfamily